MRCLPAVRQRGACRPLFHGQNAPAVGLAFGLAICRRGQRKRSGQCGGQFGVERHNASDRQSRRGGRGCGRCRNFSDGGIRRPFQRLGLGLGFVGYAKPRTALRTDALATGELVFDLHAMPLRAVGDDSHAFSAISGRTGSRPFAPKRLGNAAARPRHRRHPASVTQAVFTNCLPQTAFQLNIRYVRDLA